MGKIWVLAALLLSLEAGAGELEEARQWLGDMRARMDFIRKNGLHQHDEGRILVLDKSTALILKAIDDNGLLSIVTFNLYKHMVVKFRYSSQYFEFIRTARTEKTIAELLDIVVRIRKKLQLDEDPYGTVLKSNLTQVLEAMDALRKMPDIPDELRRPLHGLRPELGEAIAMAELGDRPKAFAAATKLHWKVRELYPLLQGVTSKPGYAVALEIMGLNEFIGEYAQVEKP